MRRGRGGAAVAVLLAAAPWWSGCGGGRTPEGEAAVRDSAGIRIVENPARAPAHWTPADPVTIGRIEGPAEYTFNRVSDVAVGPGGRVFVLDGGDNTVKVYAPDGTYAYSLGREGDGPEEFRGASRLIWSADTLEVFDYRAPKVARFMGDRFLDAHRSSLSVFELGFPALWVKIPGGSAVDLGTGCRLPRPEDLRPLRKLVILDSADTLRDTVAIRPDRGFLAIYGDRFCSVAERLGGRADRVAVRRDGRTAFGDGSTYQISLFTLRADGTGGYHGSPPGPDVLIRRQAEPIPVGADQIAAYRERYVTPPDGQPVDRERVRALEAAWDSTGFPDTYPFFRALLWDDEGRLWVGDTPAPGADVQSWAVFGDTGELIAEMTLPTGLSVKAIGGGVVWGTVRDELGVTYVRGYRTGSPPDARGDPPEG